MYVVDSSMYIHVCVYIDDTSLRVYHTRVYIVMMCGRVYHTHDHNMIAIYPSHIWQTSHNIGRHMCVIDSSITHIDSLIFHFFLHVYMYMIAYKYVYIYIHVYMCVIDSSITHMTDESQYQQTHMCNRLVYHTHIYMYVYIYIYVFNHVHVHVYMCVYIYIYTYRHMSPFSMWISLLFCFKKKFLIFPPPLRSRTHLWCLIDSVTHGIIYCVVVIFFIFSPLYP